MAKLQYNKRQYVVTIPKVIVAKKRWKKGENLVISLNDKGNIEICDIK